MTDETSEPARNLRPTESSTTRRPGAVWALAIAAPAAALGAVAALSLPGGGSGDWRLADVGRQGEIDDPMVDDGARLQRRADGITVEVAIPTPQPGSYEYPTADMIPASAPPHPPVSPGASGAPEVFSLWLFAFNEPGRCTDDRCDLDDFAPGAAARGGVYQVDGRIADRDDLAFAGTIRLGQPPADGAPLDDPERAEIHVAITSHGRALVGTDAWRQLNGPIGNPTLWWAASFTPPD